MFDAIWQLLTSITKAVSAFIARRASAFYALGFFLFLILTTVVLYGFFVGTRQFELLGGPEQSTGNDYSTKIVTRFPEQLGAVERRLKSIKQVHTGGFEENRLRIANDRDGKLIGFAHDGFGDSENVRILLPMDNTYLHILCSKKFLQEIQRRCGGCLETDNQSREQSAVESLDPPKPEVIAGQAARSDVFRLANSATEVPKPQAIRHQLGLFEALYIAKFYRDRQKKTASDKTFVSADYSLLPKIALGPQGSGTREVAVEVLRHFNLIKNVDYVEHQLSDWQEVPNYLNQGVVDFVFYLGPSNSGFINQIAAEKSSFLIGLGVDAKAIENSLPNPIRTEQFAKFQYGRRVEVNDVAERKKLPIDGPANEEWEIEYPLDFCDRQIDVLYTRRVLICSKAMNDQDAFLLARTTKNALSAEIPSLRWDRDRVESNEYSYALHPGAILLRDNIQIGFWGHLLDFLGRILPALMIPIVIGLITKLAQKASGVRSVPASDTGEPFANTQVAGDAGETLSHADIETMLEDLADEIDDNGPSYQEPFRQDVANRVSKLEQTIAASVAAEQITEFSAQGYRDWLETRIRQRVWPPEPQEQSPELKTEEHEEHDGTTTFTTTLSTRTTRIRDTIELVSCLLDLEDKSGRLTKTNAKLYRKRLKRIRQNFEEFKDLQQVSAEEIEDIQRRIKNLEVYFSEFPED